MKPAETDEFVQFMRISSPGLLRTAWLLCGHSHRAEELVQESVDRAYLKWVRISRDGTMRDAAPGNGRFFAGSPVGTGKHSIGGDLQPVRVLKQARNCRCDRYFKQE